MGTSTAKIIGAAKKIGAAVRGQTGILSTLQGEHAEVASLLDDILDADGAEERRELYPGVRQQLLVQARGEDEGLFAECKLHESTRELAERASRDLVQIRQWLATIDRTPIGSAHWRRHCESLRATVESHFELEHERLYPEVKKAMSNDKLRELDRRYREQKERIEERGEQLEPGEPAAGGGLSTP